MRAVAVMAAMGLVAVGVVLGGGAAGAASSTLTPVADAYVQSNQKSKNFGTRTGISWTAAR